MTDCLQVLSGRSLLVFDPNGEYFIEDKSQVMGDKKSSDGDAETNQYPPNTRRKKRGLLSCLSNKMASFCIFW